MAPRHLIELLKEKGLSIGSCESFTAGLFCSVLAGIPGASAVLKGGVVCYATEIKEKILSVSAETIEKYGVVSRECAIAMAIKGSTMLDTDICVSFTGNAGPSAMEGKPAGLAYCAIALKENVFTYELFMPVKRNEMRRQAVHTMIRQIISLLEKEDVYA